MKPILKLNNISFSYMSASEQITIIDSLSLEVFSGEIISIIGPEKCGKSTILSIICGLTNPTCGYISCNKTHIGYMFRMAIYSNGIISTVISRNTIIIHQPSINTLKSIHLFLKNVQTLIPANAVIKKLLLSKFLLLSLIYFF